MQSRETAEPSETSLDRRHETFSLKQSAGSGGQDEEADCSDLQSRPFKCFVEKVGEIERIIANEDYEDDCALEQTSSN